MTAGYRGCLLLLMVVAFCVSVVVLTVAFIHAVV